MKHPSLVFLWLPLCFSLIVICLYFSGSPILQQIISPRIVGIPYSSGREFGLLEQVQNLLLLASIFLLLESSVKRSIILEKCFFGLGAAAFTFLFLEEIDYCIHFIHYFFPDTLTTSRISWHNQINFTGRENEHYLKLAADVTAILFFVILPFFKTRIKDLRLNSLIPSLWFVALMALSLAVAQFAHILDSTGMGTIDGVLGGLDRNISEFRETSTYYVYFLYARYLARNLNLEFFNKEL